MKEILKQIKGLTAGDLVQVEWLDARIGKSLSNGISGIDVPVKSWGLYIGIPHSRPRAQSVQKQKRGNGSQRPQSASGSYNAR